MGLRDFLTGAQQFQQGGQEFSKTAQELRQQEAQQRLSQGLPDLLAKLRTGTPEDQARLAGEFQSQYADAGGSLKDTADVISKYAFPDTSKIEAPMTNIDDAYYYLPEKVRSAAKKEKDPKIQARILEAAATQARADANLGKREQKTNFDQAKWAAEKLDKTEKLFREEDFNIKRINDIAKMGGQLPDNILSNYVIRNVGNEKGPLSDSDRQAIMGVAQFTGQWDEFVSRWKGGEYTKMNPVVRKQLEEIIKESAKNFKGRRDEALASDLASVYDVADTLRDESGNPTGVLKSKLDKYKKTGIGVDFSGGSFTLKKGTKEHSGNTAKLIEAASKIKDPEAKKQWIDAINATDEISEDDFNKSLSKINKLIGGSDAIVK